MINYVTIIWVLIGFILFEKILLWMFYFEINRLKKHRDALVETIRLISQSNTNANSEVEDGN